MQNIGRIRATHGVELMQDIYSMDEAAEALRISRRALQEIIKFHPHYFSNGRRKLFTESDLKLILEALRPNEAKKHQLRERTRGR